MADLRIVDAPEIPTENITGEEKLPTGGNGNYSISLDSLADYTKTKKDLADNTTVDSKVGGVRQELNTHIEDLLNPHQVTKGQIGLGNVDNTADLDKPVSNSTQAAIISAVSPKADKTYVDTALSSKTEKTYVDNQLTLKANKVDVYTKSETYTKQESDDLVNNSISTALTPVNTSLDLAKRGVINRYDPSLNYNSGERVVLANGDIVKSTVDGNENDPNVDMTGWEFDDNSVSNVAQLRLTHAKNGQRVYLISVNLDQNEGGGEFVATQKVGLVDNGVTIFSSPDPLLFWVRINYSVITPEMAGAKVNDAAIDNAIPLQKVIDLRQPVQCAEGYYFTQKPLAIYPNTIMKGVGAISWFNTNREHRGTAIIKLTNDVRSDLPTAYGAIGRPTFNLATMDAVVIAYDPDGKQDNFVSSLDLDGITFARYNPNFPVDFVEKNANFYSVDASRFCPQFIIDGGTTGSYVAPNTYTLFGAGICQSSLERCNFFSSRYNVFIDDGWMNNLDNTCTFGGTGYRIVSGTSNSFDNSWALAPSWNNTADTGDYDGGKCYGYFVNGSYNNFGTIGCDGAGWDGLPCEALFKSDNAQGAFIASFGSEGGNAYKIIDLSGWGGSDSDGGTGNLVVASIKVLAFNNKYYNNALAAERNVLFSADTACSLEIMSGTIGLTRKATSTGQQQHFAWVGWGSQFKLGSVKFQNGGISGYNLGTETFPQHGRVRGYLEVWVNLEQYRPSSFVHDLGNKIIRVSDDYLGSGSLTIGGNVHQQATLGNIEHLVATYAADGQASVILDTPEKNLGLYAVSGMSGILDNTNVKWLIGADGTRTITSTPLTAQFDNNLTLGTAAYRWTTVYASTGAINTSDERLKQQFRSLSEREKDAALEIKKSICMFKFNDAVDLKGDGARWHVGVKAQQVISILESHDLNPFDYGFVCFDAWGATDEQESGSRYAVRYDELSMFILAAI